MTVPRTCDACGLKPVATKQHRVCFDCVRGGPRIPPPCRRCGRADDYYSGWLCHRCHQYSPYRPESCIDCHAWGVRRMHKWLCQSCVGWRANNSDRGRCRICGDDRVLHLNPEGACRLCWRQAAASKAPREPLELIARNRHGQQLFIANIGRISMVPPVGRELRGRRESIAGRQLGLFDPPKNTWLLRHGYREPPNGLLAEQLDALCVEHGRQHGWSKTTTDRTRLSIRALLGMLGHHHGPLAASVVIARFEGRGWPVRPVFAILAEADLFDDDRVAAIDRWFDRQVAGLPPKIVEELHVWFAVMRHGSKGAPRRRPRQPVTIRTRCYWALPTIRRWADDGHQSLREIARDDVLAALAPSGNERATTAIALRSIFQTLKARKILFTNPTVNLNAGAPATREPLPVTIGQLRAVLDSTDPACAALGALVIFHALKQQELMGLVLTDVHDGRVEIGDRSIPLAPPVRERIAVWLDHRNQRWPHTANPHLFIHYRSATTVGPVGRRWIRLTLGVPARGLREDRILDEAHATGGDVRRLVDLFGLGVNAASRYTATVDHPDLIR